MSFPAPPFRTRRVWTPPTDGSGRAFPTPPARRHARWLRLGAVIVVLGAGLALAMGLTPVPTPGGEARAASRSAESPAPVTAPPSPPRPRERAPQFPDDPRGPRHAVDALLAGRTEEALERYRGLAAIHREDPVYRDVVRILERRMTREKAR